MYYSLHFQKRFVTYLFAPFKKEPLALPKELMDDYPELNGENYKPDIGALH